MEFVVVVPLFVVVVSVFVIVVPVFVAIAPVFVVDSEDIIYFILKKNKINNILIF
jgi:hypothetical protein